MKRGILICLLFVQAVGLYSQERANNWYFGYNAGLNFSSDLSINPNYPDPILLSDGAMQTFEGCATLSDDGGDLMFYTDGSTVYNKDHVVMDAGTGLQGSASAAQSGIIVPDPSNPDHYFVFSNSTSAIAYSKIDMSANGGLGKVISKNTNVQTGTLECLAAVPNDSDGYWVVTRGSKNSKTYAVEITSSGVGAVQTSIGGGTGLIGAVGVSTMKFNPCSDMMAVTCAKSGKTDVFDFDNSTGVFTLKVTLTTPNAYGVEFSPNGRFLYVGENFEGGKNNVQYDLDATNIQGSKVTVGSCEGFWSGSMQLAPNGRIYIASNFNSGTSYLAEISNPDVKGPNVGYDSQGVLLGTVVAGAPYSQLGLPPFLSSFVNNVLTISYTNLCVNTAIDFSYNFSGTAQAGSISWDFGDFNSSNQDNPQHTYLVPGTYTVTLSVQDSNCGVIKTVSKEIEIGPNAITDPGIEYCPGDPVDLTLGDNIEYCYYSDPNEVNQLGCGDPFSHTFTGTGDQTVYLNINSFSPVTVGPSTLPKKGDGAFGTTDNFTFEVKQPLKLVEFEVLSAYFTRNWNWELKATSGTTFNLTGSVSADETTYGTVEINSLLQPGTYEFSVDSRFLAFSNSAGVTDPSVIEFDLMSFKPFTTTRSGYLAANVKIEPPVEPWCAAQPIVVKQKLTGCCVQPTPNLTLTAGSSTLCAGEDFVLTAAPNGAGGTVEYQLYKNGSAVGSPQTTTTWSITGVSASDAGEYTVTIVSSGSCTGESSQSTGVTIAVNETPTDPTIAVSPNQTTFCAGEAHTLTASSTVGSGTITYTWSGDGSGTTNPINGTTTSGSYTYTVSAEANGCTATNTASESIIVNDAPTDPTIAVSPNQTTFCAGEAHTLTASSTVGSGTITYTWSGDGSGTTNPINGTTTSGSYTYTVSAEANGCTAANTASETITVTSVPTAVISGGGSICNDGTTTSDLTVTVTDGTGPFDFTIFRNGGSHNALTDEASPYTEAVLSDGDYTLETGTLVDVNGCVGTVSGTATVAYLDEVLATNTTECNSGSPLGGVTLSNNEFQIVVTVTQGDLTTVVITETSSVGGIIWTETSSGSGVWYSNAINESSTVDINVTDNNDCNGGIDLIGITRTCSCLAIVDAFSIVDATICEEGSTTLTVEYSTTGTDAGFNVTLTQPDLTPQVLPGELGPSTTFTVDQEGSYSVEVFSVGDNCPANGSGVSLAHYDVPEAVLSGSASICNDGSTTALSVALTQGTAPFNVDIAGGTSPINVTNASTPHTEAVSEATTYTLANLTDDNGCIGTVSGSAVVRYIDDVVATYTTECNDGSPVAGVTLQNDEYQIVVTVTQGDLSTVSITETSSVGVSFTETTAGSGVWYSGAIDETNTVDINVTDNDNCNGGEDITGITETCSCPSSATLTADVNEICANGTDAMTLTVETSSLSGSSGNYTYTITGPGGPYTGIIATTGGTATESVSVAGTYVLTVVDGGESCNSSTSGQEQTLVVNALPSVQNITTNEAEYCEGSTPATIDAVFTGGTAPYTYSYTDGQVGGTGTSITVGTSLFGARITANSAAGDYADKTYSITALTDDKGCQGTVLGTPVQVKQVYAPSAPIVTPSVTSSCQGDAYIVTAEVIGAAAGTDVIWTAGAFGTFPNPSTQPGVTGQGVRTYQAIAQNGICESVSSALASVTVNPSGEVSIASVAPVCQGEDVVLTATASNVATSPTYKWYYAGFEVASGSSNEVSIPNVGTTSDWVVSVTNNTACGGEVSSQPIIVEILTKPVPKLNEFGEVLVCAPKEVELTVGQGQQPQVGAGLEISWYEGTDPTPIATGDSYTVRSNGVYSVVMSNQGCVSEASPLSVVDVKIQDLQVSIDQDNMDVEENTEVYLTTTVEDEIGNISYDWRSDETGGTIGTTPAIDYLAVSRDTIQVLIKDESSGCEAISQKVWINVLEPVNIPTAFTPNGDGINDTWNIEGLETYRNASVRIYNRWGALVYSKTGSYFNEWDGTNNGKELPNGTYYYVIQLNQPGKGDLTGDVSVIR